MTKLSKTHPAIACGSLYHKSQQYIKKALQAYSDNDLATYKLWAFLALELLGKARLSQIHPCLVVDGKDETSIWAAVNYDFTSSKDTIKTITYKTVFARLSKLSPFFDVSTKDFCADVADERNQELHSGASIDADPKKWEGRYWHIISNILGQLGSNLNHWIGDYEKKAAKKQQVYLNLLQKAVAGKIEKARSHYKDSAKNNNNPIKDKFEPSPEYHIEKRLCPICSNTKAKLLCQHEYESAEEISPDKLLVKTKRSVNGFMCNKCDLVLNSQQEITYANKILEKEIPLEYVTDTREEKEKEEDVDQDVCYVTIDHPYIQDTKGKMPSWS